MENAVKHGINPRPEGGRINFQLEDEPAHWRLIVWSDGTYDPTEGRGSGLPNLRRRLQLQYGECASFEIANQALPNSPRTRVRAQITLPK